VTGVQTCALPIFYEVASGVFAGGSNAEDWFARVEGVG